jgi:hypothetical protein
LFLWDILRLSGTNNEIRHDPNFQMVHEPSALLVGGPVSIGTQLILPGA